MTKEKLIELNKLIVELHNERMKELCLIYGDEICSLDDEDIYNIDNESEYIRGCDIIADVTMDLLSKP